MAPPPPAGKHASSSLASTTAGDENAAGQAMFSGQWPRRAWLEACVPGREGNRQAPCMIKVQMDENDMAHIRGIET